MQCAVNWTLGGRRRVVGALLFDMDGTMIDSRAYHMGAWRKLAEELGLGDHLRILVEDNAGEVQTFVEDGGVGRLHHRDPHLAANVHQAVINYGQSYWIRVCTHFSPPKDFIFTR
jgi:phosphoglycolate phosphatase-like HAD superfamily hydrolase